MRKMLVTTMMLLMFLPLWSGMAVAFEDVPETHWASAEIRYVAERGLFNGKSETTFAPSSGMTRGQMAAVLYRYAGSPDVTGAVPYRDVAVGRYYHDAILWARENNILVSNQISALYLRPDETLTRAEFAVMLYNYNVYEGGGEYDPEAAAASGMTDMDGMGNSIRNAMLGWAYPMGVLRGTSATTMNPNGRLTRAHVAAMLCRYDTMVRGKAPDRPASSDLPDSPAAYDGTGEQDNSYQIVIDVPATMRVGARNAVSITTQPAQIGCEWTLTSGNRKIADVTWAGDGQLLLEGKSGGTVTITAVNAKDGRTASLEVTVQELSVPGSMDLNANMDIRLEIVRLTNELRREHGLNELMVNDALMNAAQAYAEANPPTHKPSLSEKYCADFGYKFSYGENLAWNYDYAQDVVNGWINSPGHYQTMVDNDYDEIGIGFGDIGTGSCISMLLGDSDYLMPTTLS